MRRRTILSVLFPLFLAVGLTVGRRAAAQEGLSVPLDSPVYDELEHFRSLGFWNGNLEILPITRREARRALEAIEARDRERPLAPKDRLRLERLKRDLEADLDGEMPGGDGSAPTPAGSSPGRVRTASGLPTPAGSSPGRAGEDSTWFSAPVRLEGGVSFQYYGAATGLDSLANLDRRSRENGAAFLFFNATILKKLLVEWRSYEDYSRLTPDPGSSHWVDNFPPTTHDILEAPSARNDRAVLGVDWGWGDLRLGREDRHWGPGRWGTLFLSENAFPLDGVSLRIRTSVLTVASLFAQVNRARTPTAGRSVPDSTTGDSYFAGHRIELALRHNLHFGAYEAAAWGGRGIDLGYLNPVGFIVAMTQDIYDRFGADDKKILGGDLRYDVAPFTFYGEFLLNRLVSGDAAKLGPDSDISSFAELAGGHWSDPAGWSGADLEAEYAHLDPEVYFHKDGSLLRSFVESGEIIGDWAGPNADALHLVVTLPPRDGWGTVQASFQQVRWGVINGLRGTQLGFIGLEKKDKGWITGLVQTERIPMLSWSRPGWRVFVPGRFDTVVNVARVIRTGDWSGSGWQAEIRLRWTKSGVRDFAGVR